ncbi:autotransporter outer membrane beta-barrel domain-containing protein [Amantichitinum ursilacus]|uniref:Extracellular serine protease n=1 Tax=Amantichitinum ursilacus TaxID=857265 RepID=A0A0N0GPV3_9NEIS|nr:autotransporter domain-containing protein [Amantichitinum ursilacus]KPC54154.1 Extracellular serine protease precursor [Amantichitinum ursilacus]
MPAKLPHTPPPYARTLIHIAVSGLLLYAAPRAHAADITINSPTPTVISGGSATYGTTVVGSSGVGTLHIDAAGVYSAGLAIVGSQAGSNGVITISGAGSQFAGNNQLTIGDVGTGTVNVQTGGQLIMNNGQAAFIGRNGGSGTLNVAGGSYASTGHLHIGWASSGVTNVSAGGTVNAEASYLGFNAGGNGQLNIADAGSSFSVNWLGVGLAGAGTVSVSRGGTLNSNFGQIGSGAFAGVGYGGTVGLSDAGSTWHVGNTLNVGQQSSGLLSISNGAAVTSAQTVIAASAASANSAALVTGSGSRLDAGNTLAIGQSAVGTLVLQQGATVNVGSGGTQLGSNAGARGTLVIGAAAGQAAVAAGTFNSSTITGGAGQGEIVFNHTDADYAMGSRISGNIAVNALAGHTTLTANNSWSGSTRIDSGATLQLGNGGSSGALTADVLDNGVLAFNRSDNASYAGSVSGSGALQQIGSGSTILTGNQRYSGGTTIAAGSLQIGDGGTSGSFVGNVLDNATLAFNRSDAIVFAGAISGSGVIAQSGVGTTVLTGVSSNAAGAIVAAGTLQIGDGGNAGVVSGNIRNDATLAFNRNDDQTYAGSISGVGQVVQAGKNTLTLAGNNSYSGGTLIAAGTLQGQAGSFGSGAIDNRAALVLQQDSNAELGNLLQGNGSVTKLGNGRLVINGQNSLSGATTVAAGELQVNGALAQSAITLQGGTRLSGVGSVGSVQAGAGSVVAPGQSVGTGVAGSLASSKAVATAAVGQLGVAGDFAQASGSSLAIRTVPGSNAADLLQVDGTATLAGGNALIVTRTSSTPYTLNAHYTVLHADGGINWLGAAGYDVQGDTQLSSFYSLRSSFDQQNVYLQAIQTRSFTDAAGTPNQLGTASGLDGISGSNTYRDGVGALTDDAAARRAFDLGSGELHASIKARLLQQDDQVQRAALAEARVCAQQQPALECTAPRWWGRIYNQHFDVPADGNAAHLNGELNGAVLGLQVDVNDWRLGAYAGYGRERFSVDALLSLAHSNNGEAGLSAAHQLGAVDLRVGAMAGWMRVDSQRTAAVGADTQSLSAAYTAKSARLFAEAALPLQYAALQFEPYLGVNAAGLATPAFTEQGGDAALHAASEHDGQMFSDAGVHIGSTLAQSVNWQGAATWRHRYGPAAASSTFSFAEGTPFAISSAVTPRNTALLELGLNATLAQDVTAQVSYSGQFAHGLNEQTLQGTLNVAW